MSQTTYFTYEKHTAKTCYGPRVSLATQPGLEFRKVHLPVSEDVGSHNNIRYLSSQYYHCSLSVQSVLFSSMVKGENVLSSAEDVTYNYVGLAKGGA